MGLNICKNIVESFDGEIYFDENRETGSKFTFTFKCLSLIQSNFDRQRSILSSRQYMIEDIDDRDILLT